MILKFFPSKVRYIKLLLWSAQPFPCRGTTLPLSCLPEQNAQAVAITGCERAQTGRGQDTVFSCLRSVPKHTEALSKTTDQSVSEAGSQRVRECVCFPWRNSSYHAYRKEGNVPWPKMLSFTQLFQHETWLWLMGRREQSPLLRGCSDLETPKYFQRVALRPQTNTCVKVVSVLVKNRTNTCEAPYTT